MSRPFTRILTTLLTCALPAAAARAETPTTDAQVRTAIQASLPFLQREGVAWMNERKCMSCHTVTFMLWSFNLAKSRGIAIDDAKLAEWTQWSLEQSLAARAAGPNKGGVNDGGGLDTLSQLFLSHATGAGNDDATMSRFLTTTPALMLAWQKPDGHWQAAGQMPSQDRPKDESDTVTTRWAALALGTIEPLDTPTQDALAKALQFARNAKPGTTTESLLTRFLIDRRFGKSSDPADLLKRQNPDGGWPWQQTGPSDAYSAGQALYALAQSPTKADFQAAIDRARHYLVSTQQPDGTWPTTGQGISNAATPQRKKKVEPIYRYWGTAWATIGLASILPPR